MCLAAAGVFVGRAAKLLLLRVGYPAIVLKILNLTGVCLITKLYAFYPWIPIRTIHQIIDSGRLNFSY
jgi:hypothetical protein